MQISSAEWAIMNGIVLLITVVTPLLVVGWLLVLAHRAVRALESIAESLRQQGRPGQQGQQIQE